MFYKLIKKIIEAFKKQKPELLPVVDLTALPPRRDKIRGLREVQGVNTVITHVTAIQGGFGPGSSRTLKWQRHLSRGWVDPALLEQLQRFPQKERAKLLALWERYSELPYHWMGVPAAGGHTIHNLFPSVYSYHAGVGNKNSVGWALDCQYDEELSEGLLRAGRESLRQCIQEVHHIGGASVFVQAHRNYSDMRANDPGPIVWQNVVLPVVEELEYAKIRYDYAEGTGKPIPESWSSLKSDELSLLVNK